MGSMIWILEEGKGYRCAAEYSLPPKAAMVAYIKQYVENNWNTWEYPDVIEGMRESDTVADHWYFDLYKSKGAKMNANIAAYPNDMSTNYFETFNRKARRMRGEAV